MSDAPAWFGRGATVVPASDIFGRFAPRLHGSQIFVSSEDWNRLMDYARGRIDAGGWPTRDAAGR